MGNEPFLWYNWNVIKPSFQSNFENRNANFSNSKKLQSIFMTQQIFKFHSINFKNRKERWEEKNIYIYIWSSFCCWFSRIESSRVHGALKINGLRFGFFFFCISCRFLNVERHALTEWKQPKYIKISNANFFLASLLLVCFCFLFVVFLGNFQVRIAILHKLHCCG